MIKEDIDFHIYLDYLHSQGRDKISDIVLRHRPGMKESSAMIYGWRVLNSPEYKEKLRKFLWYHRQEDIISFNERRKILSEEVKEGLDKNNHELVLKAIHELNRMEGVGTPNVNLIQNNFTASEKQQAIDSKVDALLGNAIDADYIEES